MQKRFPKGYLALKTNTLIGILELYKERPIKKKTAKQLITHLINQNEKPPMVLRFYLQRIEALGSMNLNGIELRQKYRFLPTEALRICYRSAGTYSLLLLCYASLRACEARQFQFRSKINLLKCYKNSYSTLKRTNKKLIDLNVFKRIKTPIWSMKRDGGILLCWGKACMRKPRHNYFWMKYTKSWYFKNKFYLSSSKEKRD